MKIKLTITETNNIKDYQLIDQKLISIVYYDKSDELVFENNVGELRNDRLINVSLYDDLIILNDKKYKILNMLTK